MKVSANELLMTATKACIGKGVPRGVAQDIGRAVLDLALERRDGLTPLLAALDRFEPDAIAQITPRPVNDGWEIDALCVLPHGPGLVDLARTGDHARAAEVDFPELIHGLAKSTGLQFEFEEDDGAVMLRFASNSAEPADAPTAAPTTEKAVRGIAVDSGQWQRLGAHAALILVPADESNRADAGAGLTDND